jgi:hypothetical protein
MKYPVGGVGLLTLALLFALPAQAQHGKPQRGGRPQVHSQPRERGEERGHGRNEGRVIDTRYRHENFGRENHAFCGAFYGRPTFLFGGIWFGINVWPSYWLSTDYVYVEYVDGDYYLVNERLIGAEEYRVAIVIE